MMHVCLGDGIAASAKVSAVKTVRIQARCIVVVVDFEVQKGGHCMFSLQCFYILSIELGVSLYRVIVLGFVNKILRKRVVN